MKVLEKNNKNLYSIYLLLCFNLLCSSLLVASGIMIKPFASHPPLAPRQSSRRVLPAIVLAALAIRMLVVVLTYRGLPFAEQYLSHVQFGWEMGWIARALASGHGFSSPYHYWSGPTAMQPPLFPLLLAGVFRLFGIYTISSAFVILSINSLLSALTCIPIYSSAKFSLGARAAELAAILWAVYPFAIYFSAGRVWEYALTGLLFTTCFCISQRIHHTTRPLAWIGWGALFGLCALSNPAILSLLPFLLLMAMLKARRFNRRWLLNAALTGFATLAVLSPWVVRNYRALGILCPVRDNFWMEFYSGNWGDPALNPISSHPVDNPAEMQRYLTIGEKAYMAEKHTMAIAAVKNHPLFVVKKTLRRVCYYWTGFWSFSADELRREPYSPGNVLYCCCISLLMLRGIHRLWRLNRSAALPYLILIAVFPLTYYLTYPLMDYRQPIEPAILVLSISGALPWKRVRASRLIQWTGAERALEPAFVVENSSL
jgi:4-amino-4-deoxy-L-arabinose transferase-like glycosyltransferase